MTSLMNRYASLAVLVVTSLLSACGDKTVQQLTEAPLANSRVRFFNFGVNAPAVNFYADATKMTAVLSTTGTESTNGIAYGGVSAGGDYSAIAAGPHALAGKIAATTDKDLAISTLNANIEDGKYYSFYLSGPYNTTTKTVDNFIVEDPFTPPPDLNTATVRFVHAIYNANAMTLYAKSTISGTEVPIGAQVAYKGAGAFVNIPAGSYDISARYGGVTTNALSRTGVSFNGGRVYTITARGDITVAPTTTGCAATNRTCLDNTANR